MLEYDSNKGYDYNTGITLSNGADSQKFIFVASGESMNITTKNSQGHAPIEIDEAYVDDNGNIRRRLSNGIENISWYAVPVEEFVLFGDLDDDGRVDTFDLVILRQAITNEKKPGSGDINDDGEIGVADLVQLERFLLGRESFEKTSKGTPRNTIKPQI